MMLMNEPMPSIAKELQTMSRLYLKVAVRLLTVHTTLSAHMFKLRLKEWQDCQLCGDEREDSEHVVNQVSSSGMQKIQNMGCMFLKPKD
jgi:hypothetical protein